MRPGEGEGSTPPATGRRDADETPPRRRPPLPAKPLRVYQRRKKKTEEEGQDAMGSLPEDPLINILSRIPYSSVCRFKSVSRAWLRLCSAPEVRKASTQILTGFFHNFHGSLRFRNLNGRGPPMVEPALHFLMSRAGYTRFKVMHCSTSLLLCKCSKKSDPEEEEEEEDMELVVCNPATEEWTVLPPIYMLPKEEEEEEEEDEEEEEEEEEDEGCDLTPFIPLELEAYLGFDAKSPSYFVVFVPLQGRLNEVLIYSSNTGRWVHTGCDGGDALLSTDCVLLHGLMHMMIDEANIVAMDAHSQYMIPLPELPEDVEPGTVTTSMGQSQGLLHTWCIVPEDYKLSVWVLEDYYSDEWTLKYTVELHTICGIMSCDVFAIHVFAVHPEKNMIFITDRKRTTISYDMDSCKVHPMCNSGEFLGGSPFIPFFGNLVAMKASAT